jgi:hypothetical protein
MTPITLRNAYTQTTPPAEYDATTLPPSNQPAEKLQWLQSFYNTATSNRRGGGVGGRRRTGAGGDTTTQQPSSLSLSAHNDDESLAARSTAAATLLSSFAGQVHSIQHAISSCQLGPTGSSMLLVITLRDYISISYSFVSTCSYVEIWYGPKSPTILWHLYTVELYRK